VIALGNALSRGLGLVRDLTIAYVFGATASTDAYVIARALPNTLYDLLVGTVNTAAFVPVFVQYSTDRRQFWRLVGAGAGPGPGGRPADRDHRQRLRVIRPA
jgi:putative peptidoglycan lipid II flippase